MTSSPPLSRTGQATTGEAAAPLATGLLAVPEPQGCPPLEAIALSPTLAHTP